MTIGLPKSIHLQLVKRFEEIKENEYFLAVLYCCWPRSIILSLRISILLLRVIIVGSRMITMVRSAYFLCLSWSPLELQNQFVNMISSGPNFCT